MSGLSSPAGPVVSLRAPLVLAVESATSALSVAVLRGEELLLELFHPGDQHHAQTLLPLVHEALRQLGLGLQQIEAFGVSIGPGSFTSLRIGLATVKGLAFGTPRLVAPVSTLAALAWTADGGADSETPVVPLLDARRGEAYAAGYRTTGGELSEIVPEGVYTPGELAERTPRHCRLVGEGAVLFGDEICALKGLGVENLGSRYSQPRAAAVGALAVRALAEGQGRCAEELAPRYLRRAEAEVKRTSRRFEDSD